MKICPGAIAIGCKKCPIFKLCPLKGVIGDYSPGDCASSSDTGKSKTSTPEGGGDNSKNSR